MNLLVYLFIVSAILHLCFAFFTDNINGDPPKSISIRRGFKDSLRTGKRISHFVGTSSADDSKPTSFMEAGKRLIGGAAASISEAMEKKPESDMHKKGREAGENAVGSVKNAATIGKDFVDGFADEVVGGVAGAATVVGKKLAAVGEVASEYTKGALHGAKSAAFDKK